MSNILVNHPVVDSDYSHYRLTRNSEVIGVISFDKNIRVNKSVLAKRALIKAFKGLTHSTCFADVCNRESFDPIFFDRTGKILSLDKSASPDDFFENSGIETIIQVKAVPCFLKSRLPTSRKDKKFKAYEIELTFISRWNWDLLPFSFSSVYVNPTKIKTLIRHVYNIYLALGYKEYLKGNK